MEKLRLIHSVGNLGNLKSLIKQDLREFGVKAPKSKKTKKLNPSRNSSQVEMYIILIIFFNFVSAFLLLFWLKIYKVDDNVSNS